MASISKITAIDADNNNTVTTCDIKDKTEISGVSGTYGPTSNVSPVHGTGTFTVPYFTVNSYGKITTVGETGIMLPSDSNTDTKVTQKVANQSSNPGTYSLLLTPSGQSATTTTTSYFSTDLQYTTVTTNNNPQTQILKTNKMIQGKVTVSSSRLTDSGLSAYTFSKGISHTIATSSMTYGKPTTNDGHIIYLSKGEFVQVSDINNYRFSALYIKNSNNPIYIRYTQHSQFPGSNIWNDIIFNETEKPTAQQIVANTSITETSIFNIANSPLTLSNGTVSHTLSNPSTTTESVTTTTTYPYKISCPFPVYNQYGHVTSMKNREYLLNTTNYITGTARDCTSSDLSIQAYYGYTGDGWSSTSNSPIYMESGTASITSASSGATNGGITVYTGSASVTFENSFSRTPCIYCTWSGSYTNHRWIKVINASTTGFTVYGSLHEGSVTRNIQWFAIGPKNHV